MYIVAICNHSRTCPCLTLFSSLRIVLLKWSLLMLPTRHPSVVTQTMDRTCGLVWRGVAWRGVAWCGVVWRGVVWCGVA